MEFAVETNSWLKVITQFSKSSTVVSEHGDGRVAEAVVFDAVTHLSKIAVSSEKENLAALSISPLSRVFQKLVVKQSVSTESISIILAILDFYESIGEEANIEAEKSLKLFFAQCLTKYYANEAVTSKTIAWLQKSRKYISKVHPEILPKYFPLLLKIIIVHSPKLNEAFKAILPSLVGPTSFLPLFSHLLDLPVMSLALEEERRKFGLLPGEVLSSLSAPKPPQDVFALLDRAYIGGGGSSPGSDSGGELGESEGENGGKMGLLGRLFRALMEDENSGILEDLWANGELPGVVLWHLQENPSDLVDLTAQICPDLLEIFMGEIHRERRPDRSAAVFALVLKRVESVFQKREFNEKVQRILIGFIRDSLSQSEAILPLAKKPILSFLESPNSSPQKLEMALALIFSLGENCGALQPMAACQLAQKMEMLLLQCWATLKKNSPKDDFETRVDQTVRLLRLLISSLSKFATCHFELCPRVKIALKKIAQSESTVAPQLISSAKVQLKLLEVHSWSTLVYKPIIEGFPKGENVALLPFNFLPTFPNPPYHDFTMENVFGEAI